MTTAAKSKFRWRAVAYYRTNDGLIDIEHHFSELEDLQELIERGPSFNAIDKIEVFYNWGSDEDSSLDLGEWA